MWNRFANFDCRRIVAVWLCLAAGTVVNRAATERTTGEEFFEKRVRPLLAKNCYDCHSVRSGKSKGGLLLDSREGWMKGGQSGPAIKPGAVHASLLLKAVGYTDPKLQMPPDGRLSDEDIRVLERWIAAGAMDPRSGSERPVSRDSFDFEKERLFWSFQPVRKPDVPTVENQSWPLSDVDRFLLARMEKVAVKPASAVDRVTWLRRTTFSLTGLPPTVREIGRFLDDRREESFARKVVIDRLLESKAYGEHFARHWLDLVRYADTSGAPSDYPLREMWRYRDYVVEAFNEDLPFDQFVREQLAGDLLVRRDDSRKKRKIIATGYLALAKRFDNAGISKHLIIEDVLDNLGKTFLGLSLGCARCHDHKYDPVPARDYYALYGIFESTLFPFPGKEHNTMSFGYHVVDGFPDSAKAGELFGKAEQMTRRYSKIGRQRLSMREEIRGLEAIKSPSLAQRDRLKKLETQYKRLSDERSKMKKDTENLRKKFPGLKAELIYAVRDGEGHNARFQYTGDPEKPGDVVSRGFLRILGGHELPNTDESGRRELAEWLTSSRNPLTARVIVNRVWQWHFGRGLVETANDFGHRGAAASHPELLDWLATWFVENNWSVKSLNRLILNTRAYAISADAGATPEELALYAAFRPRRLTAEEIRDSLLLASGKLTTKGGGAHELPAINRLYHSQGRPYRRKYPEFENVRSLYLFQHRNAPHPFLTIFDGADPSANTPARGESTTALQSLFFLNSEFFHECANAFAVRLEKAGLAWGFKAAYGRPATDEEMTVAMSLHHQTGSWRSVARMMLAANPFVFVE